MTNEDLGAKYVLKTYNRFNITFTEGKGSWLIDDQGNKYLDFVSGIAVNSLGYGDEEFSNTIKKQVDKLLHCSNLYWNEPMLQFSKKLVEASGLAMVFYCNSGAEANEAAFKLARRFGNLHKGASIPEVIAFEGSFHGRTFAAMSITGQQKYQEGFSPLVSGVKLAKINELDTVISQITENTSAIFLEPIQGEGGIVECSTEFIKELRKLCNKHDLLLVFDEIQCGIGRTGKFFAYENYNVLPDIVTLAKGIANGLPMGAMLVNKKASEFLTPGTHASTFGGNPFVCSAANFVIDKVNSSQFLKGVQDKGDYLKNGLKHLANKYEIIKEVRGMGLILGVEFCMPVADIINSCIRSKLLLVGAGANVIRFVPPLVISENEIKECLQILDQVLKKMA